ncbi:cytochrome c biogenesis protein ResB [Bacillus massiliglaciei]|uniref:cytochrome c biogenesis protein ResB n=1 Tax=Bacillus massiliglaciei TaxID=1816693 RepID=UPI000A542DD4|nr:cytochrome c biogenesis protein ResB [Bacillus massiliglaciei]
MNDLRCECGHVSPRGTVLCESCGRLLVTENADNKLADMRYEGSARRSQTYNKTVIDKIWNFFSSVKVGVSLIVLALAASAVGTILPQEMYIPQNVPPADYYKDEYGWFGTMYYTLGFHNLYGSWWYIIIIAMLGTSLLIASIDRFFPLYRSLKNQRIVKHDSFFKRQRLYSSVHTDQSIQLEELQERLEKKRYKVRMKDGSLLAEKGRFSRWGPYVNHIGLIVFLVGALLRSVPGMYVDKVLWLREGETKEIPGTDGHYYLKNNAFILETYSKEEKEDEKFKAALEQTGSVAKNYQANVTLYENESGKLPGEKPKLKKIKDSEIKVNQPLKEGGYALYQVDFKMDELSAMSFNLVDKETGEKHGSMKVDLNDPQQKYDLGKGYSVELMSYFPDFEFTEDGKPTTATKVPDNPAFFFKMFTPETPEGETSFVAIQQNLEPLGENQYKMEFAGIETKNVTGLTVRKDLTLGILFAGGIIFMIGVIQGSYWNHRRIWIKRKGSSVLLAGHTNKNWLSLRKDIAYVIEGTPIAVPDDQLDGKASNKGEVING